MCDKEDRGASRCTAHRQRRSSPHGIQAHCANVGPLVQLEVRGRAYACKTASDVAAEVAVARSSSTATSRLLKITKRGALHAARLCKLPSCANHPICGWQMPHFCLQLSKPRVQLPRKEASTRQANFSTANRWAVVCAPISMRSEARVTTQAFEPPLMCAHSTQYVHSTYSLSRSQHRRLVLASWRLGVEFAFAQRCTNASAD